MLSLQTRGTRAFGLSLFAKERSRHMSNSSASCCRVSSSSENPQAAKPECCRVEVAAYKSDWEKAKSNQKAEKKEKNEKKDKPEKKGDQRVEQKEQPGSQEVPKMKSNAAKAGQEAKGPKRKRETK